jgi:YidC/Oxa1 family membrane protein insertase
MSIFHFIGVGYHFVLYQPLLNALILLYNTIAFGNLGLAIILLTIAIRLLLYPLFHKSVRHQMVMQKIQPKLAKLQEEHKGDKEKQYKATMDLYREHNVNPFSGFLLLFVQLPVLIALYRIFLAKLTPEALAGLLYPFVHAPQHLNYTLFGLINLEQGSILLVALAALSQYFQIKLSMPKGAGTGDSPAEKMGKQMMYIGPAITLLIFYRLPAAISLYWTVTSLFSILQQSVINRQLNEHDEKSGTIHKKTP